MPTKYVHTNLVARDWEKLADFYTSVFGCERIEPVRDLHGEWLAQGTGVSDARLRGQHLRLPGHGSDGPTLEIFQYDEIVSQTRPVANRAGYGHISFAVDDVDDALRSLLEAGGTAEGAIVSVHVEGAGQLAFTYARDPEGNLIELQSWM